MSKIVLVILLGLAPIIVSAQEVVLYTDPWPPYYHEEGRNGYITEVAREAFKAVGYELTVEFRPWKRVLAKAADGESDGILGAFYEAERENDFIFSDPVGSVQIVFFRRSADGDIPYESLEDLTGYRIGTIAGYTYSPAFDAADYLVKEPANGVDMNIRKLQAGRIDLFLEAWAVAVSRADEILSGGSGEITPLLPPLQTKELYVLFSRELPDAAQKAADFNRGLELIRNNGTYDRIMAQ